MAALDRAVYTEGGEEEALGLCTLTSEETTMSLQNLTLLTGATVTASGGTTQTYGLTGQVINGGIEVIDASATDLRTAERVSFVSRMPKYNSTSGEYSKTKLTMVYKIPTVDAGTGLTYFNLGRIEVEVHPSLPAATQAQIWNKLAQLCVDSDTSSFRTTGALA